MMTARFRGFAWLTGIALAALLLDLGTKTLALRLLSSESVELLSFLNLRLRFNRGVSFGLLAEGNTVWITLLTGTVLAAVTVLAVRVEDLLERAGYALIIGGGFANLADRLHDGVVTDFIDFHMASSHFPAFNLADVAISFGVCLIVILGLVSPPAWSRPQYSGARPDRLGVEARCTEADRRYDAEL